MLKKNKEEKNLSHAYFFACEDGVFLKEFVELFSKLILNREDAGENFAHPDFSFISSEKTISVKDIEDIASDVYVMPYESDFKVYAIYDASLLTEEAQNKLLKTIEEPPKSAIIILASKTQNGILPTILSRVNKINLKGATESDARSVIEKVSNQKDAGVYLSIAGTNIEKALSFINNKEYLLLYENVLEMLEKVNSSKDILGFVSKINLQKIDIKDFFDFLISILRDIMMVISGKEELVSHKDALNRIIVISQGFTLEGISLIMKEAFGSLKDIAMNANAVCVLDEFLLKMVEVKVKCKK